jgi:hypothetical protein
VQHLYLPPSRARRPDPRHLMFARLPSGAQGVRVALAIIAGPNMVPHVVSTPEVASRLRMVVSLALAHLMKVAAVLRGAPFISCIQ